MPEGTPGAVVGRNVRKLRERGMYSRPELAERAGVSLPGITRLELGEVPRPRRTTLEKLARVLGVPVETLLEPEAAPAPLGAARSELPAGSEAGQSSDEQLTANNVLADEPIIDVDFDGLQMRLDEFCAYWEGILEERTPDDRVLDRRDLDPLDLDRFDASSKLIAPMIRVLMGVEMVQLGPQEPGSEPRFYSQRSAWGPGIMRFANLDIRMRKLSGDQFGEAQPVSDEVAQIRRMAS